MARKAGEAGKRRAVVACRLSDAEHAAYADQVEASGLTSGEYLRRIVVDRPVTIVARPKASAEKGRLVYLYNKASNNLNQIAHRLHAAHAAGKATAGTYERALGELIALGAFLRGRIDDVD